MGSSLDWIKRVGAGLIIVVLAGMLVLTFGRVPPGQLADMLQGRVGSFNGESIEPQLYFMAQENCRQNMAAFGQIPDFILNNCVSSQLKQMYVLPSIASKLGLETSEESVQTELMQSAMQMYESQKNAAADDRLTVREIYNRQLMSHPLETRVRMRAAQNAFETISAVGDSLPQAKAEAAADAITMTVRIVRFTNNDLASRAGNIQVSEEETKAKHEKDQSIFDPAKRKSYESQREIVRAHLISDKQQTAIGGIKQQLASLGRDFKMEDVERLTGRVAMTRTSRLSDLKSLSLPSGEIVHLDSPEFLLGLGGKGIRKLGPIQDGEATIYVEVSNIQAPPETGLDQKAQTMLSENKNQTGRVFYDLILKKEAQRGKFRIKTEHKGTPPGMSPPPDDGS